MEGSLALFSLEGRTAIVTGAASGLGRSIAVGLGQAGAYVVAADLPGAATEEAVEEIGPDRAIAVGVDVTRREEVAAMTDLAVGRDRPPRRPRQQRGDRRARRRRRVSDRALGPSARGQPDRHVQLLPARRSANARLRLGLDRQPRVDRRARRLGRQPRLPGEQGRRRSADPDPGGRVGGPRGSGQRDRAVHLRDTRGRPPARRGARSLSGHASPDPAGPVRRARGDPRPALFLVSDAAAMVTGHILTVDGGYTSQ